MDELYIFPSLAVSISIWESEASHDDLHFKISATAAVGLPDISSETSFPVFRRYFKIQYVTEITKIVVYRVSLVR